MYASAPRRRRCRRRHRRCLPRCGRDESAILVPSGMMIRSRVARRVHYLTRTHSNRLARVMRPNHRVSLGTLYPHTMRQIHPLPSSQTPTMRSPPRRCICRWCTRRFPFLAALSLLTTLRPGVCTAVCDRAGEPPLRIDIIKNAMDSPRYTFV